MSFQIINRDKFQIVRDDSKLASVRFLVIPFMMHGFVEAFLLNLKSRNFLDESEIYCVHDISEARRFITEMEFHGVIAIKNDSQSRFCFGALESEGDVLRLAEVAAEKKHLTSIPLLVLQQFIYHNNLFEKFFDDVATYRAGKEVPMRYRVEDNEIFPV